MLSCLARASAAICASFQVQRAVQVFAGIQALSHLSEELAGNIGAGRPIFFPIAHCAAFAADSVPSVIGQGRSRFRSHARHGVKSKLVELRDVAVGLVAEVENTTHPSGGLLSRLLRSSGGRFVLGHTPHRITNPEYVTPLPPLYMPITSPACSNPSLAPILSASGMLAALKLDAHEKVSTVLAFLSPM